MSGPRYLPNCAVIWRGPSLIDGRPIVVAVTGLQLRSPCVWVFEEDGSLDYHPIRRSVHAGRYATREPFHVPGYVVAHGKREAVPSAVWAALDG